MKNISSDKGSVTILMALMSIVILAVGVGFNWLLKEHLRMADGLKEKTKAIVQARSAYDTLIYLMLTGDLTENAVRFRDRGIIPLSYLPLDGTEVMMAEGISVRAQDSNGSLSVATFDAEPLRRLFRNEGAQGNVMLESFLDWNDPDEIPRMSGAESSYYRGTGVLYGARNYGVQYLGEMAFIRGNDPDLQRRLAAFLTVLPTTGFNPNTASYAVLKAFLDIDDGSVSSILRYRSQRPITSLDDLFRLTGRRFAVGEREEWFKPSSFIDVVVSVGVPRSLYRIRGGISIGQALFYPYFIHYWQEE